MMLAACAQGFLGAGEKKALQMIEACVQSILGAREKALQLIRAYNLLLRYSTVAMAAGKHRVGHAESSAGRP
jgi:hypothetical protein